MHKCTNCGYEFDSKFCPDCGTQRQENKTCPGCGAQLHGGIKFCPDCGYSFTNAQPQNTEKQKKETNQAENKKPSRKIYAVLKHIPALLFVFFGVLLFAFYAAPVAVMPAQEVLEEKIPAGSYGNVYSMYSGILSEIPELKAAMLALLVLASITLLTALCAVGTNLYETRINKLSIFGGFVFYIAFFILGCVLCGKIAALNKDRGMVAVGACPILITVFSLFFLTVSAGICFILIKKYQAYIKEEYAKAGNKENKSGFGFAEFSGDTHLKNISPLCADNTVCDSILASSASLISFTIYDRITSIVNSAFYNCINLKSITFSNRISIIDNFAFKNCKSLTNIFYNGTKAQWAAIEKGVDWNYNTGNYTVRCTDGDLDKEGKEIV